MPALVITAVDNTTDTLTSVAHGLNTGDGATAIFAGSGGVIPTGLAGVTDYYVIRTGADTLKLASSSANALAGTAINITSNGTLPLSLGIGLPYRVPMIAAAGVQIKAANDNSAWGVLVALWNLLTAQAQSIWSAITLAVNLNIASGTNIVLQGTADIKRSFELGVSPISAVYGGSSSYDQTNHYATNSGAAIVTMPIHGLKVGDRITTVDFNHFGNAGAYISVFSLQKMTAAGVQSFVATSGSISTPTGATWNTYTLAVGSPAAVAAGEVWWVEWAPSSAVQRLQGANVKGDRG